MATNEVAATAAKVSERARASRPAKSSPQDLEAQIARLQDDIKAIGESLARLSGDKVSEVRDTARKEYKHALRAGQHVVDDVVDQAGAVEKQLKDTIREKPLTAVASAIGIGFVIALLTR